MAFDGALFSELVEKITIQNNSTAIFRLINGWNFPNTLKGENNDMASKRKMVFGYRMELGTSVPAPKRRKRYSTSIQHTSPVHPSGILQRNSIKGMFLTTQANAGM